MCKIKTMLIRAILLSYRNKECHHPTAVATIINFHPTSLHPPRAQVSNHFNSCPTICMTYLNLNKALNFELILNLNKKKWLEIKFIFQILKQNLWLNTDRVPSTQWVWCKYIHIVLTWTRHTQDHIYLNKIEVIWIIITILSSLCTEVKDKQCLLAAKVRVCRLNSYNKSHTIFNTLSCITTKTVKAILLCYCHCTGKADGLPCSFTMLLTS